MIIYSVYNVKNVKALRNGSNIDYLYETSSVLRKARETEISFGFGLVRVFKNRNRTDPKPNRNSVSSHP